MAKFANTTGHQILMRSKKVNRNRGIHGEHHAANFLRSQGYKIVARNYRWRGGEIDLIARDGSALVFIEVKSRTSGKYGLPEESITQHKQEKIILTAQHYLQSHPTELDIRFDVVALTEGQPRLIQNAFGMGF